MEVICRKAGMFGRENIVDAGKLIERTFYMAYEGGRFLALTCRKEVNERRILTYHFEKSMEIICYRIRVHENDKIPSISIIYPSALPVENEAARRYGLEFIFCQKETGHRASEALKIRGKKQTYCEDEWRMSFGPYHAALNGLLNLNLSMKDETILEAVPKTGYVHRNIEEMLKGKGIDEAKFLIERICGKCNISHSLAYCQGIEELHGINVPERGKFLRTVWAELERIQHHLSVLLHISDVVGIKTLLMNIYTIRENLINVFNEYNGKRVITGMNIIGGTSIDIDRDAEIKILLIINELAAEMEAVKQSLLCNSIIKKRLYGVGVLDKNHALKHGAVGPAARASGIVYDARMAGYGAYGNIDFEPVVTIEGDCYCRISIIIDEIVQSADIIEKVLEKMPPGKVCTNVKYTAGGEILSIVEQPGGELIYYIRTGSNGTIENISVKSSSATNFDIFIETLKGCSLDDIPVIMDSFGICIACMEK